MSEPEKIEWFQSLYVCMVVPGLLEVPERRAIVTLFSTNKSEPLSGRLRFYILNSVEQVSQILLDNKEYNKREGFLPYVEAAVKKGIFPEDSVGLPEAEMTEHTHLAALAAALIDSMMREQVNAEQAAAEAMVAVAWTSGDKPKA